MTLTNKEKRIAQEYDAIVPHYEKKEDEMLDNEIEKTLDEMNEKGVLLNRHPQTDEDIDKAFENLDKDLDEDSYNHEDVTEDKKQEEQKKEEPKGEVVVNTKEEQRLLKERTAKEREIEELIEKNIILKKEAEKFEKLVSTMDSDPFIELKNLVTDGLKSYVDRCDVKEAQKKFNNFKAICQMQELLKEYKQLADDNRTTIASNEEEIEENYDRIDEINLKLNNFQQKLNFEQSQEEPEREPEPESEPEPVILGEEEVPF